MSEPWQFWLDVGGTFTDCLAVAPDSQRLRRKVLSSAVIKGRAVVSAAGSSISDPARDEPLDFWRGYRLRLLGDHGQQVAESIVSASSPAGSLELDPPVHHSPVSTDATFSYELQSPEEAPLLAIRLFFGLRLDQPIPRSIIRLGTTRGTNALLTRRGAKTAFVTTRGFADVLQIGYQNRPRLFELNITKSPPLFSATAEIDERVAADGSVLWEACDEQIRAELSRLQAAGIESLAICLLNSYANPCHELQVEHVARDLGFAEISVSSRVSPLLKIVPRGDTTVVDAYLNPVLRTYLDRIADSLPLPSAGRGDGVSRPDLSLMTSAGGLVSPAQFTGKDSLLSGPAGGYVGCARVAAAAGFATAIGFDMGGTSTDVSRYDGQFEFTYEAEKAGVRIAAPMLAIETVAAGGGSICRFDGTKLVVGPQSAGADPGPACYGRGGPLTITDCNLYLGRLLADHFPFPLDRDAVATRLAEIASQFDIERIAPFPTRPLSDSGLHALAAGFLRIANDHMAQAIRSISIAKGYDPRDYVLVACGAAGPQHACAVADELGISQVLIHPDAGVLSALGIGLADVTRHCSRGVYQPLNAVLPDLPNLFDELSSQARAAVRDEGVPAENIAIRRVLDLRYVGADAALSVDEPASGAFAVAFEQAHHRLYGYNHAQRPVEVVAARVAAIGRSSLAAFKIDTATVQTAASAATPVSSTAPALFHRHLFQPGQAIAGPALIAEPLTTTFIDLDWQATVLTGGELLLQRSDTDDARAIRNPQTASCNLQSATCNPQAPPDPIQLELFNSAFTAIATQMGLTLRNTAISVNVKERLDFSCAIFTPAGDLVVNAPHIPVHLGAMGETVKAIIADNPDMQPGDVFLTNDPYRGGSHLPDVTVITPVFSVAGTLRVPSPAEDLSLATTRDDSEPHAAKFGTRSVPPTFFTASRAHHAEIGGITPGSMPPFSKSLAEEGVLIRNFKLLAAGQPRLDALRELLSSGPYPSRSVETNLADIRAQLAANQQGANDLHQLVERHSLPVVQAYMRHIQAAAEAKTRAALARLPSGRREFADHLDDGTPIRAAITIHPVGQASSLLNPEPRTLKAPAATIDFTGTGPVSPGNLNANPAIVTAAVMYVLRLLVNEDIPLNQGVLAPVEIVLPCCLLNPEPRTLNPSSLPAIACGNVETSQRIVDVLLGAFGLAAASQGTMNNLLFGDETFGYYETICGGSGATASSPGAHAVHTHMTNTRLTDPEVLEARYPVRLREFSIRRGSGGAGKNRGGDGVVRRLEFLKPLTLSILSQRRGPYPPYGLAGGEPGAVGHNELCRVGSAHHNALQAHSFNPEPKATEFSRVHEAAAVVMHQRSEPSQAHSFNLEPPAKAPPEPLPALVQTRVQAGDILTIETPGGGGWGTPPARIPDQSTG